MKSKIILPGKDHGFTLVEVMIVVGIIGLLAAISIPLLKRARLQADETAAIAAVKALVTAEESWRTSNPDYAYMNPLVAATPPHATGFTPDGVGWWLHGGTRYHFYICNNALYATEPQNYSIFADPQGSGGRYFCAHADGIVRVYNSGLPWPGCSGNAIAQ